MSNALLAAIYVPLVIFTACAAWLYGRHVLWPALTARSLSTKEHGVAIGMVCMSAADVYESAYYGIGRVFPDVYAKLSWHTPGVTFSKVMILAGAIFVISSYFQAVHGRGIAWPLAWFAVALWAASAVALGAL